MSYPPPRVGYIAGRTIRIYKYLDQQGAWLVTKDILLKDKSNFAETEFCMQELILQIHYFLWLVA